MDKEPMIYLLHIIDAITNIENYTKGISEKDFYENKLVQDAVVRNLEIIGEAAKRVPNSIKKKHADIEWKKISGMRDILIHDYLGVDHERVWMVIHKRIPELKRDIQDILRSNE
jgi:uncharacterized protein with HEPN domain